MKLEDIKTLINDGYDSIKFNIKINKIDRANDNLDEFSFGFGFNEAEKFYKRIGTSMKYLEMLARDRNIIKDYVFKGRVMSVSELFDLTETDSLFGKDRLKFINKDINGLVLLDREPLEIFKDRDDSMCLVYRRFGYIKEVVPSGELR